MGVCALCGSSFDFSRRMQVPAPNPALVRRHDALRQPPGLTVDRLDRDHVLRITFQRHLQEWNLFAGLALAGIAAGLTAIVFALASPIALIVLFFPIVGLVQAARREFSAHGVASITASKEALTVAYDRPSREPLILEARDVAQLYVVLNRELEIPPERRGVHEKTMPFWRLRYALCALSTDGRRILLVPDLRDREQARFLEHVIELHLGIDDIPVDGELPVIPSDASVG